MVWYLFLMWNGELQRSLAVQLSPPSLSHVMFSLSIPFVALFNCHRSSFPFRFILSPVWWVTRVRDSESSWQHYLTVPSAVNLFRGWRVEVSVTYFKRTILSYSALNQEYAATSGKKAPLLKHAIVRVSLKLLFSSTTQPRAHIKHRSTYVYRAESNVSIILHWTFTR